MGGAAYGMPRKAMTSSLRVPATRPPDVPTTTSRSSGDACTCLLGGATGRGADDPYGRPGNGFERTAMDLVEGVARVEQVHRGREEVDQRHAGIVHEAAVGRRPRPESSRRVHERSAKVLSLNGRRHIGLEH